MPVISHLSFSPSGGAGEVMTRLSASQQEAGWDSRVFFPLESNLRDKPFSLPRHTAAAALDDGLMRNKKFHAPISVLRDRLETSLDSIPSTSDLIHLHWINGVATIKRIRQRFPLARLVWTLHDMNPFTGACHQSLNCEGFITGCGACPAVKPIFHASVGHNFTRKELELNAHDVTVVCPSNWLADQARRSPILRDKKIHVVSNPIAQDFLDRPAKPSRVSGTDVVASLVAGNLSDPLKGVAEVIHAHQADKSVRSRILLRLIGARGSAWSSGENTEWLGALNQTDLKQAYADSDYVIQASRGESFGLSVIEGASQGATPIVRSGGALEEIQRTLSEGIAFSSPQDLATIFQRLATTPRPNEKRREQLRASSRKHFGSTKVLEHYDAIYAGLGVTR